MPETIADRAIVDFGQALSQVMRELEKNLLNIVGSAKVKDAFDATVLLNSQPAMIEALRDAGYFALAEEHIATYAEIPKSTIAAFKRRKLPAPEFTTLDKQNFAALAQMDLDQFNNIGIRAMNELRLGLVRNAVSGSPFNLMVDAVRDATVGTAANGSPLSNYAYTHANTAILNFSGQTLIAAGESIGFTGDSDKWEVVGPLDGSTREICQDALANPVRTRKEWESIGYWGGTPGGFNCRHLLYPVFE